ncbi:MAG: hypothetical protein M3N21_06945 [Actinomycetota bacterium]|nr:hypothetical protein [Actinomycetota bacterium]
MPDEDAHPGGAAPQGGSAGDDAAVPPHESVVDDLGGPPSHPPAAPPGHHPASIDQLSFQPSAADIQRQFADTPPEPAAAHAQEFLDTLNAQSVGGHLKAEHAPPAAPVAEPFPPSPDVVDPDPASRRKKVLAAMAAVGLTGAAILAIALNQGGDKSSATKAAAVHSSSPAPGASAGAPAPTSAAIPAGDASGPLRTSGAFNGPLTPQGPAHCYQGELNHAQFTAADGTPMFVSTSARLVDILTSSGEFRGTGSVLRKALAIEINDVLLSGQGKSFHLIGTVTCGQ